MLRTKVQNLQSVHKRGSDRRNAWKVWQRMQVRAAQKPAQQAPASQAHQHKAVQKPITRSAALQSTATHRVRSGKWLCVACVACDAICLVAWNFKKK